MLAAFVQTIHSGYGAFGRWHRTLLALPGKSLHLASGTRQWWQAPYRQPHGIKIMLEYLTAWIQVTTDCRAVTALEYGLIAALIAGVIVTVVATLGTTLAGSFNTLSTALTAGIG